MTLKIKIKNEKGKYSQDTFRSTITETYSSTQIAIANKRIEDNPSFQEK